MEIENQFISIKKSLNKDVKGTLVYFSSVGVPPGKFNGSSALIDTDYHIVFVNCKGNTWYLRGIPHFSSNIKETASKLKDITESLANASGKVIYYGGSMGGYGAVLFGALNNASKVIATGVEIDISKKGGYFHRLSSLNYDDLQEIPDINSIIRSSCSEFHLLFGELQFEDYFEIHSLLSNKNVKIFGIANCGHSVPMFIQKSIGLKTFLDFAFDGTDAYKYFSNSTCQYPYIANLLADRASITANIFENIIESKKFLDSQTKGYLLLALCKKSYINKNYKDTIKYATLSSVCLPQNPRPVYYISKSHLKSGNLFKFQNLYEEYIALSIKNGTDSVDFAYLEFAEILFDLKKYKKAQQTLDCIKGSYPPTSPMGRQIITLSKALQSEELI